MAATKQELRGALDIYGVPYPKSATTAQLRDLVEAHEATLPPTNGAVLPGLPGGEPLPGDTPVEGVLVTKVTRDDGSVTVGYQAIGVTPFEVASMLAMALTEAKGRVGL